MSQYKHIFFDLDHTLWDFDTNCSQTLEELYHTFDLSRHGINSADLIEKYKLINYHMWFDYNRGKLTKKEIRDTRFQLTFQELGIDPLHAPKEMNEEFLKICPAKGNLMPYTHEVLTYLMGKYKLHIITNGFKETQSIKITTSGLDKYFSEVVNSELVGFSKPDKKIFDYALGKANANTSEGIMIGDDLYTDIKGARDAGMDHVYYNPNEITHEEEPTFEIKCLSELKTLL